MANPVSTKALATMMVRRAIAFPGRMDNPSRIGVRRNDIRNWRELGNSVPLWPNRQGVGPCIKAGLSSCVRRSTEATILCNVLTDKGGACGRDADRSCAGMCFDQNRTATKTPKPNAGLVIRGDQWGTTVVSR